VSECCHYATSNLATTFSPWPLVSLAPGKVRQDLANGQRPKAASVSATGFVEVKSLEMKLMASHLHQVRQSQVLELRDIGSTPQLPTLQCAYQHLLLLSRDPARPIREVALG